MELAILANAPFCQPGGNFMDNVLETIDNNIELNLFTVTEVTAVSALAACALVGKSGRLRRNRDRQQWDKKNFQNLSFVQ